MQTSSMPALFIGHGNPMNTLADNRYTAAWRRIAASLPKPRAILAISAHWYVPGVAVTAMPAPVTIHDFTGFSQELFDFRYRAPGDPALAQQVSALLRPLEVELDQRWGIDHGVWSVLAHMFPQADVPVLQLSMDRTQPATFHYELGRQLAPLRDEGVLLLGSGNVVHNLAALKWESEADASYDWAARFEQTVKDRLARRDHAALIDYERLDADAQLAVPTREHYLPLLYVIGAQREDEPVSFPIEGIDMAALSMLSAWVGQPALD